MSAGAGGGPVWWMCCRERPEPTAARALTADQWANQAGMGGAMGTPRQAVATGAYPVKDGRREGETVASGAGQEGQDRGQPKASFKACGGSGGLSGEVQGATKSIVLRD